MKKMKGIILGMVFVFGMSFTADANAVLEYEQDCLEDAWDYGTEVGDGSSYMEWLFMSIYVEAIC